MAAGDRLEPIWLVLPMTKFERTTFSDLRNDAVDPLRPARVVKHRVIVEGHEFVKCTFESCWLAHPAHPADRSILRNLRLVQCTLMEGSINGAVIEDVEVDTIKKVGRLPSYVWGAVFRHVRIRGNVTGTILVNDAYGMGGYELEDTKLWESANREFYDKCDWALDISEARFATIPAFRGIPGRLFRLDPASQLLVRRRSAETVPWRGCGGDIFEFLLEDFLKGTLDSIALIASTRGARSKSDLAALANIRATGVGE